MNKNRINSKLFFVFLLFLQAGIIVAQKPSSDECNAKLVAFKELVQKAGDEKEIYIAWVSLKKNCATSDESIFVTGEQFLQEKVLQANTSEEKNTIIQELVALYDEHDKVFPANKRGNRIHKAILLYENNQGTSGQIYSFLDQSFSTDESSFTSASVLNIYSKLIADQLKEGKLTSDEALEKLDKVYGKVQSEHSKLTAEKNKFTTKQETAKLSAEETMALKQVNNGLQEMKLVSKNIDGTVNSFSNCETLTAFYQKNFEKNSKNGLWLETAFERLNSKKCKSEFYLKVLEKWNEVAPTAKSSYNLALVARQSKDRPKAIEYFLQSASFESDAVKKADIFYLVATTYGNANKEKASEFAKKAIEANPASGKSYIFLAQLYSNSATECAKENFDKKAIYWLAASIAKQAGIVEPSLKKSADELASGFNKLAPSKAEIAAANKKSGEKISYGCWINETVSIPKL